MIRFLADENFDNRILRGLLRRDPTADIVRVQDTEISGADDPVVLEWAAREGRILLTHDIQTLNGFANERLAAGLPMPGVFQIGAQLPIGPVIENLVMVNGASEASEWDMQIKHFPLF